MQFRIKQTKNTKRLCFSLGKGDLMTEMAILVFLSSFICQVHFSMLYKGFLHHSLADVAQQGTYARISHRTHQLFFLGCDYSPPWCPYILRKLCSALLGRLAHVCTILSFLGTLSSLTPKCFCCHSPDVTPQPHLPS